MSSVPTVRDDSLDGVGNPFATKNDSFLPKGTVMKMFTGNLADPGDCAMAEALLTKSLECQGYLNKPGDVYVFERTGTFDKAGDYHIFLYYAMLPEKQEEKKAPDAE